MIENGTQIGEYRIDGSIGQGGMAEVYKAWQGNLQRYEALKVLLPQMAANPNFVDRFLKEARTAANLQHTNIASIHTVSSAGAAQPFFTMELLTGGDLSDWLHQKGRLTLDEALPLLKQIASALDFAHSQGLIHRDIKPANILLKPEGNDVTVKVVDFGISKAIDDDGGTRLTQTGMFIGTPEYMSPEQAGSGAVVDQHTDQYSLAVMAYEMLCGAPPFRSESNTSVMSVMMKHVRDEPLPPSQLNASLSPSVDAAILKALAKNPADRFDSCGQFVQAMSSTTPVRTVVEQRPIQVAPPIDRPKSTFPLIPFIIFIVMAGAGLIGFGVMHAGGTTPTDSFNSGIIPGSGSGTPGDNEPQQPAPVQVSVPDVTGKTWSDAQTTLSDQSLIPLPHYRFSDSIPNQQVMSQSPGANTMVDGNSSVTVFISKGQDPAMLANQEAQAATAAARPAILRTVDNWSSAWERSDANAYMANYTSDARIFGNQKWYSYSEYYNHESQLFSQGGTISVTRGNTSVNVSGNSASVGFPMTFQRWGGKGDYKSSGYQKFKMRNINGSWMIYEDIFSK